MHSPFYLAEAAFVLTNDGDASEKGSRGVASATCKAIVGETGWATSERLSDNGSEGGCQDVPTTVAVPNFCPFLASTISSDCHGGTAGGWQGGVGSTWARNLTQMTDGDDPITAYAPTDARDTTARKRKNSRNNQGLSGKW